MEIITTIEGDARVFYFAGDFTFKDHIEFKKILHAMDDKEVKHVTIDLSKLEFIDSAALGMLLVARDKATECGKTMALQGAVGQVMKVLKISNFHELFKIG